MIMREIEERCQSDIKKVNWGTVLHHLCFFVTFGCKRWALICFWKLIKVIKVDILWH